MVTVVDIGASACRGSGVFSILAQSASEFELGARCDADEMIN